MIKYKYKLFFGVSLVSVLLFSCTKYLDQKPDNLLTEEQIWKTKANAEAYLNNIYSYVHQTDGGDWASMGGSDESSVSITTTNVRQMVSGNWSAGNWYFYSWGDFYKGIRKSFVFEANIDKLP